MLRYIKSFANFGCRTALKALEIHNGSNRGNSQKKASLKVKGQYFSKISEISRLNCSYFLIKIRESSLWYHLINVFPFNSFHQRKGDHSMKSYFILFIRYQKCLGNLLGWHENVVPFRKSNKIFRYWTPEQSESHIK